jgi:hypothetical protein
MSTSNISAQNNTNQNPYNFVTSYDTGSKFQVGNQFDVNAKFDLSSKANTASDKSKKPQNTVANNQENNVNATNTNLAGTSSSALNTNSNIQETSNTSKLGVQPNSTQIAPNLQQGSANNQLQTANTTSLGASSNSLIGTDQNQQILYKPSTDGKTWEPYTAKEVQDLRAQNLKSTQDYNAFMAANKEKEAKNKENNAARIALEDVKIAKVQEENKIKIAENNIKIQELQTRLDGYKVKMENYAQTRKPDSGPSMPEEYWLSKIVSSQINDLEGKNYRLSNIDLRSLGISPRF